MATLSLPSRLQRLLVRASTIAPLLVAASPLCAQSAGSVNSSSPALAARAPECDTGWTTPRDLLTREGLRVYVEGPSTLATRHGVMLTGSPTVGWMSRTNFIDTTAGSRSIDPSDMVGVTLDSSMAAVPLPRLKFASRPTSVLAMSDRGTPRIVWSTASDTALRSLNSDSLWTANLTNGAWSPPESFVQGQRIRWFTNVASVNEVDGDLLLLVPMQDTTKSPKGGFLLVRRTGDAWTRRWTSTGMFPPMGASVIVTGTGALVVAMTGEMMLGTDTSSNAVFVQRLRWRDSSRAATRILRRVGSTSAIEPKLFSLGGTLHLIWLERLRGHAGASTLFESTSTDEGTTWTQPSPYLLPGEFRGLNVLATSDRTAFAALQDDAQRESLVLARDAGGWRTDRDFTGYAFTAPILTTIEGVLTLMFGSATFAPEVQSMVPRLLVASRPLRCEVRSSASSHR